MNSHQRRKAARYWRYHAVIQDSMSYEDYMEVREWCQQKFGIVGHRWSNTMHYIGFSFCDSKDFTLFAMRWL